MPTAPCWPELARAWVSREGVYVSVTWKETAMSTGGFTVTPR